MRGFTREKTNGLRRRAVSSLFGFTAALAVLTGCAGKESPVPPPTPQTLGAHYSFEPEADAKCLDGTRLAGKKLIEWGHDQPDPAFMKANIATMEQRPFNGVIFGLRDDEGKAFEFRMWDRAYTMTDFIQALDDLKTTPFTTFTDRFVRVNVADILAGQSNYDWYDETRWQLAKGNFAVAARIAKESGSKGFMLDTESYGRAVFSHAVSANPEKTLEENRAILRQRGRELVQAINAEFSDITILLTFAHSIVPVDDEGKAVESDYQMLPDFLDGMLEASTPSTRFVDGGEVAYGFKERSEFQLAYDAALTYAKPLSQVPEKYTAQMSAGFGIWLDFYSRQRDWNGGTPETNYFTPDSFGQSVRCGLQTTDEYVWIYTERPNWWTLDQLSDAYLHFAPGS